MSTPLLTTKLFFPPACANLISRPRLVERLNEGLGRRLTLISAPAGYGKTMLLSEWRAAAGRDLPVAWLSIDADDSDWPRFLLYLLSAFEAIQPGLAGDSLALLGSLPLPRPEAILTPLLNDLSAFSRPTILALDDYYLIHSREVHEAVAFLLARQPANLHLVILTREDPPLPMARLRARGEMSEIREADLRFSVNETAAFLRQSTGLNLPERAVRTLVERTEGWAAGLQMASLALQAGSDPGNPAGAEEFIAAFHGDDRYVMDYLLEEVFRRQPGQIQDFLLNTAILERLSAAVCAEVLAPVSKHDVSSIPSFADSQAVLEHLERNNLFLLPLDNRREWYRYHHLFADLLLYRLQRQHPERLPELHRRASAWFLRAGYPDEAMSHALAIHDYNLAADVAEQFMLQMTGSSRLRAYLNWLQQLPEAQIATRAFLCAGCGWAYVLTYQPDLAEKYVQAGEAALAAYQPIYSTPDERWISSQEVRGNLAAIRSFAATRRGETQTAIEHAGQALEILPGEASGVRGAAALNLGLLYYEKREMENARQVLNEALEMARKSSSGVYVATSVLRVLGVIASQRGRLNEALSYYQRSIEYTAQELGARVSNPSLAATHQWLVELYDQRDEIETAQEHQDKAFRTVEQMGALDTLIRAYLYQSLLEQRRGKLASAADWLRRAEELLQTHAAPASIRAEWVVIGGQLRLFQGDPAAAQQFLAAQEVRLSDLERLSSSSQDVHRLPCYLFLVRLLFAQGDSTGAERLLERLYELAGRGPEFPVFLDVLVWKALIAARRRGSPAEALPYLERALDLAAAEGYVRPFLDAGRPLVSLLRQAIAQGIQPAYAQKLLAALAGQESLSLGSALPAGAPAGAPEMYEPLTTREIQILRLLAAGLSSTEVAGQLFLSVSTIRSYIKVIYRKLDAHSRDEAVEKGRQWRLV